MKRFAYLATLLIACGIVAAAAVAVDERKETIVNGDLSAAAALANSHKRPFEEDLEEDPNDRFITTRSGKRRPNLVDEQSDWDQDVPVTLRETIDGKRVLNRSKRCGDGNGGGANRARRARRARAARRAQAQAARANQSSTTTTTVVRKVIQNGQVISTETIPASAPATTTRTIVQHLPVVHAQNPIVVQQQPQPQQLQLQQAPAGTLPSIAVQGSIKIN